MDSSRNGQITSARLSLVETIIATSIFDPSLLRYHSSDRPVGCDHSDLRAVATISDRCSEFYSI
jgi:hypothetical protein